MSYENYKSFKDYKDNCSYNGEQLHQTINCDVITATIKSNYLVELFLTNNVKSERN